MDFKSVQKNKNNSGVLDSIKKNWESKESEILKRIKQITRVDLDKLD
jgi:hypothetical protein